MKQALFSTIASLLLACLSFAQNSFEKLYGAPDTQEGLSEIARLPAGGFVLGGFTGTVADKGNDFWLIKTDEAGTALWEKNYGRNWNEELDALTTTSDGGFLLAGNSQDIPTGRRDGYLVKTDELGNEQWSKVFEHSFDATIKDVIETADNGYLVALETDEQQPQVLLHRLDTDGEITWTLDFDFSSSWEEALNLILLDDGSFLYGGNHNSSATVAKISADGTWLWEHQIDDNLNGLGGQIDAAHLIKTQLNTGFLIVGRSWSAGLNVLTKITDNADVIWQQNMQFPDFAINSLNENANGEIFALFNQNIEKFTPDGTFILTNALTGPDYAFLGILQDMVIGPSGKLALTGASVNEDFGGDGFLLSLSADFEDEFLQFYGDMNPDSNEWGWSVQETSDGGFMMTGYKPFPGKKNDFYVVKTDDKGMVEWEANYGGPGDEFCYYNLKTADGGYVLFGRQAQDNDLGLPSLFMLKKIDEAGNLLWETSHERPLITHSLQAVELNDGNMMFLHRGSGAPTSIFSPMITKTNALGDTLWTKRYEVNTNFRRANLASDGNVLTIGWGNGAFHGWAMKIDTDGGIIWETFLDNPDPGPGRGLSYGIEETSGGDFLVSGSYDPWPLDPDSLFLAKLDPSGQVVWEKFWDVGDVELLFRPNLIKTNDGNFIISPSLRFSQPQGDDYYSSDKITLLKVDEEGEVIWTQDHGTEIFSEVLYDARATSDGGGVFFGRATDVQNRQFYLLKVLPDGTVSTFNIQPLGDLKIWANPSAGLLNLKFESERTGTFQVSVYDLKGQLTRQFSEEKPSPVFEKTYSLSELPSGSYFVKVGMGNQSISRMWMKE